jgi:hypothetical protein
LQFEKKSCSPKTEREGSTYGLLDGGGLLKVGLLLPSHRNYNIRIRVPCTLNDLMKLGGGRNKGKNEGERKEERKIAKDLRRGRRVGTVTISGDEVLRANHTNAYLTHCVSECCVLWFREYVGHRTNREELVKLEAGDWQFERVFCFARTTALTNPVSSSIENRKETRN